MEKLAEEAKTQMARGDKRGAVHAMKKRRLYEEELAKIDNVKMTLETQAVRLEGAAQNMETFKAMDSGNSTMKTIRKAFGLDRVDELLDNVKDEMDYHRDVDNAFTQPIDPCMADDDELLAELNALGGSEGPHKRTIWPNVATPSSSTTVKPVAAPVKTEEVKLRKKESSRFALFA